MSPPPRIRKPKSPVQPRALRPAVSPDDDPDDEKTLRSLLYEGTDFSGRAVANCDIEESRLDSVRFGAAQFEQVIISDSRLEHCDLANLKTRDVSLLQSVLEASRLTGSSWSGALIRDVLFVDCRADLVLFRQSKLRSVRFRDCNLRQSDFQWAEFQHVEFVGCDLSGAQFANASMSSVVFTDCRLDGVGGVRGLRGSTLQSPDLISLGPSLALELGIGISD